MRYAVYADQQEMEGLYDGPPLDPDIECDERTEAGLELSAARSAKRSPKRSELSSLRPPTETKTLTAMQTPTVMIAAMVSKNEWFLKNEGPASCWRPSSHAASRLERPSAFLSNALKCSSNTSTAFRICGM
jgi:hypothetical protein